MFFFKNHAENNEGDWFQTSFLFFKKALYEVKASGLQFSFNIFQQVSTLHTLITNYIKVLDFDLEICSILIFQKRVWGEFLHHILLMIVKEKYFSCYILLTDQISLSDCLYFLRYWAIYYCNCFLTRL